jgi:hypothetical protein
VAKLYKVTPRLANKKVNRDKWTAAQQDLAAIWEQRAVMVQGYLIGSTPEGEEACNCKSDTYIDHHLWLAGSPNSPKKRAMVVEVSRERGRSIQLGATTRPSPNSLGTRAKFE